MNTNKTKVTLSGTSLYLILLLLRKETKRNAKYGIPNHCKQDQLYDQIMSKLIENGEAREFANYCDKYDNGGITLPHTSFRERSFFQWLIANRAYIKGSDIIIINLHASPVPVRRSSQFGPIAEYLIDECGLSSTSFKPVYTAWELYRKLRGEDIHESDSVSDGAQQ